VGHSCFDILNEVYQSLQIFPQPSATKSITRGILSTTGYTSLSYNNNFINV